MVFFKNLSSWYKGSSSSVSRPEPELTSPTRPTQWHVHPSEERDDRLDVMQIRLSQVSSREAHTPEGLRGRRSAARVRQELQQQPQQQRQQYPAQEEQSIFYDASPEQPREEEAEEEDPATATTTSDMQRPLPLQYPRSQRLPPRAFLVERKQVGSGNILPPAPSASWSLPKESDGHLINYPYSPQVSSNGFYHESSLTPQLVPGKAKTAVGALVAQRDWDQQHGNSISKNPSLDNAHPPLLAAASSASTTGYEGDGSQAIPHDTTHQVHSGPSRKDRLSPNHGRKQTPTRYQKVAYSDEQAYYPLDKDPIQESRTPPRPAATTRETNKLQFYMSPMTVNSSFQRAASPSDLEHSFFLNKSAMSSIMGQQFVDTPASPTTSSRAGLMRPPSSATRYNFASVHDSSLVLGNDHVTEVVLAHPSDQTHISAMSQSLMEGEPRTTGSSNHSFQAWETHPQTILPPQLDHSDLEPDLNRLDESLRSRKMENQRCLRQELIIDAVERLQDNLDLVQQVGHAVSQEMHEWFVETKLDQEGLLTGFCVEHRRTLVQHLTTILQEINGAAQPEEFLVLSPSELPQFSEAHSELYQALHFCRSLVQMAIPQDEMLTHMSNDPSFHGRWSLDSALKSAMGLDQNGTSTPQNNTSPEPKKESKYGGDASVFTLPSESCDTPMTSNLSLSSAIRNDWHGKKRLHQEGQQVKRTVELMATLLEKLSQALRLWLEAPSMGTRLALQITRDLKRYYLQLVNLSHDDMVVMVHSFDLRSPGGGTAGKALVALPSIAQLVSCDEDDLLVSPDNGDDEDEDLPEPEIRPVDSLDYCFSPVTSLAMRSSKTHEVDDLRRASGSMDHEDCRHTIVECRE